METTKTFSPNSDNNSLFNGISIFSQLPIAPLSLSHHLVAAYLHSRDSAPNKEDSSQLQSLWGLELRQTWKRRQEQHSTKADWTTAKKSSSCDTLSAPLKIKPPATLSTSVEVNLWNSQSRATYPRGNRNAVAGFWVLFIFFETFDWMLLFLGCVILSETEWNKCK